VPGVSMLKAGFAQADITPKEPVELAGYFNRRVSQGVLDPLFAKALVLDEGGKRLALIVLDLIGVSGELTERIRGRLSEGVGLPAGSVMVCATHTHTAPVVVPLFGLNPSESYVSNVLLPGVLKACKEALAHTGPFRLRVGQKQEDRGLAFNRRYWMRDGRVVTNPPKGSADVVGPEGPIDHQVQVYAFEQEGRPVGVLVDANNHTDTVGGNLVSADWPGWMAAVMAETLGEGVQVMLLNGPAGNINHFDPAKHYAQTSYDEAKRIGAGYAEVALAALESAVPVPAESFASATARFFAPYRRVSRQELEWAENLRRHEPPQKEGYLTSEDLAVGHPYVDWMYAGLLLEFHKRYSGAEGEELEIGAFRIGQCAFVGLPGEPFSAIGMAIKENSPFATTTVFALCNGLAGYVPMPECFERGGYEPRTTPLNRFAPELATLMIENAGRLVRSLKT